jgi:hypothetical protein
MSTSSLESGCFILLLSPDLGSFGPCWRFYLLRSQRFVVKIYSWIKQFYDSKMFCRVCRWLFLSQSLLLYRHLQQVFVPHIVSDLYRSSLISSSSRLQLRCLRAGVLLCLCLSCHSCAGLFVRLGGCLVGFITLHLFALWWYQQVLLIVYALLSLALSLLLFVFADYSRHLRVECVLWHRNPEAVY